MEEDNDAPSESGDMAPPEQEMAEDEPGSDAGSGYIDAKASSDTDVYGYTKQGDQYTVDQSSPVGHITKGDNVKVADVVDSTETLRMVERDVGIGFAADKSLQFKESHL